MNIPNASRTGLCAAALFFAINLVAAQDEAPRGNQPFSPEESLAHFVLSPELDIEINLVASEPNVCDPVAIAFDESNRLYVVEMRDYPNGPADGSKPMSRIRLLEDEDGDGQFETSHIFVDELLFATGLLPWRGGLIATLAGEIRYFKDTDGDHKADVNEVWFDGFMQENPQLRANHPTLGPDGWIYVANGLRGGVAHTVKEGWDNPDLELRGGDFRFHPDTGKAEVITGNGQFGITFDAWGNRFICSNRNPCDQVMFERFELERNPALVIAKPIQEVAAAGDASHVFPLVDAWTTSTLHSGQFTAACGVKIFSGNGLSEKCVGNVFTCEPTGSLLHRERLNPQGGTFVGERTEPEAEFLASRDSWFRPVNTAVGPDGALYVVDMYRAVIEHPQFMPAELKNRQDLRWGEDLGRIYRISAKGNAPQGFSELPTKTAEDWANALNDANGWARDTATRLFVENADEWSVDILDSVISSASLPESRVRAIQLAGFHAARTKNADAVQHVLRGLGDADPQVVAASVAVIARWLDEWQAQGIDAECYEKIVALAQHPNATVRFEVARTLGQFSDSSEIQGALAHIAVTDASDPWTINAILTSTTNPIALYDAVTKIDTKTSVPFLTQLAEVIGRSKKADEAKELLKRISTTGPEEGWAIPILLGLGRGSGGSLAADLRRLDDATRGRYEALFAWAAAFAADESAKLEQRLSLVALIGLGEKSYSLPMLLELYAASSPQIKIAVAKALGPHRGDERIASTLLEEFQAQPPSVRTAVLDALLADPSRAIDILNAVKDETISTAELGPTRIAALARHADKQIQSMAQELFAPPADRAAVLKAYQSSARMNGDSKAGRAIFEKNCVTCHRIGQLGTQVGPDIADSRTRTPDALLTDILDPNRAIDGRYLAYSVVLNDGTVQTGLIASETGETVVLAQPEGKTISIDRSDILEMRSDGTSLMPVGIERTIPPEDMANLISFIKNWRYLDGNVPLGEQGASAQ